MAIPDSNAILIVGGFAVLFKVMSSTSKVSLNSSEAFGKVIVLFPLMYMSEVFVCLSNKISTVGPFPS